MNWRAVLLYQGKSHQDKTTAGQLFPFTGHWQNQAKNLLCLWYTAKAKLNSIKGTLAPSIGLFIWCNGLCFLPAASSKQEQNEDKSALTQGWQSIDIYGFLSPAIQQEGGIPQGCFPLQSCYPPSSSPAQGHTEGRLQPPLPSGLPLPSLVQPPALPCPAQEPRTIPVWSSKQRPNSIFRGSTTDVIPVCHWGSWRRCHGVQRSLPPWSHRAHYAAGRLLLTQWMSWSCQQAQTTTPKNEITGLSTAPYKWQHFPPLINPVERGWLTLLHHCIQIKGKLGAQHIMEDVELW